MALLRRIVWVSLAVAGGVVLVVGLVVAGLVLPYMVAGMTACSEEERAAFKEFPHYGNVEKEPEPFGESGGCAVFYDTPDSQERVADYYTEQLKAHGWKTNTRSYETTVSLEERDGQRTFQEVEITAHRDGFSYGVLFESHEYYDPPRPGVHVAVHLSKKE